MSLRQRRVAASPVSPEPQEMARNAAEPLSTRDPWAQRNSASTEAFGAAVVNFVIVTPMVLWGVVLLAGTATYAGPGAAQNAHLPLAWYDALFVRFGPLFFMLPLALRAFSDVADETSLPTPARAFVVYAIVGLVRLAVYLLGLALGSRAMSDHLFLGATVVASAQGEAVACAATALRLTATARAGGGGVSRARLSLAMLAATAGMLVATALLVLQCGDAYATAAYFHPPRETVVAWATGFALCQSVALVGAVVPAARSLGAAVVALA
jgi:hypothetical protein